MWSGTVTLGKSGDPRLIFELGRKRFNAAQVSIDGRYLSIRLQRVWNHVLLGDQCARMCSDRAISLRSFLLYDARLKTRKERRMSTLLRGEKKAPKFVRLGTGTLSGAYGHLHSWIWIDMRWSPIGSLMTAAFHTPLQRRTQRLCWRIKHPSAPVFVARLSRLLQLRSTVLCLAAADGKILNRRGRVRQRPRCVPSYLLTNSPDGTELGRE